MEIEREMEPGNLIIFVHSVRDELAEWPVFRAALVAFVKEEIVLKLQKVWQQL